MADNDLDVVRLVSDNYHELSMALAGMLPSDPGYNELDQKRAEVGVRLDRLVREFFKDNTKRFVKANTEIAEVNLRAKRAIEELESLKATIDAVTGLINTIDGFIAAVFPIPA